MEAEEDRSATFLCTAVFVAERGIRSVFTGATKGTLTKEPQCPIPKGIPVSALYSRRKNERVCGYATTRKNEVSHRGKAMEALRQF